MQLEKRHSVACDRNQAPIGDQLQRLLSRGDLVWEIGSGTGQHAVYFGERFGDIIWQPSDRRENHSSILAWLQDAALENVQEPLAFDLFDEVTPVREVDLVFCSNTIHIAPWPATQRLFLHAARALKRGGVITTYGPYRYAERELEPSNVKFEEWLKSVDAARGIRTFEEVDALAFAAGFSFEEDITMPSNNHLLRWRLRA